MQLSSSENFGKQAHLHKTCRMLPMEESAIARRKVSLLRHNNERSERPIQQDHGYGPLEQRNGHGTAVAVILT